MRFSPGDLVMNAGEYEGHGYVWRVESYHSTNPYDPGDRAAYIHATCVKPLRGKYDPKDWHIGIVTCNRARRYQHFSGDVPPVQVPLMFEECP